MRKDLLSEITSQSDALIQLAPKLLKLDQLLEQPIVSNDLIDEFKTLRPDQREAWAIKHADQVNTNASIEVANLLNELASSMSAVFGSNEKVQEIMQSQHKESLQAANPKDKSYGIDQQD